MSGDVVHGAVLEAPECPRRVLRVQCWLIASSIAWFSTSLGLRLTWTLWSKTLFPLQPLVGGRGGGGRKRATTDNDHLMTTLR